MNRQVLKATFIIITLLNTTIKGYGTLAQNDFDPLESSHYRYNFLNENLKAIEKDLTKNKIYERLKLTISPFAQKASRARDSKKNETFAGDLHGGPWNIIGLTYGTAPAGQVFSPTLLTAKNVATYQDGQKIDFSGYSDTNQNLGFFSVPLKYQKLGIRFGLETRILGDLVVSVHGGLANIKQRPGISTADAALTIGDGSTATSGTVPGPVVPIGPFINRQLRQLYTAGIPPTPQSSIVRILQLQDYYGTATPGGGAITSVEPDIATVESFLTQQYQKIFNEIGLDITEFNETGPEDIYASFVWRHNFFINTDDAQEYAPFIMTPFIKVIASAAIGKEMDPAKAFSIPFGNNGHHAISVNTGFSVDFYETVEVSWQAGATHFFTTNVAGLFVPTDTLQQGVYPFKTNVTVAPGKTWFFSVAMNAYRFIDKLSFFGEYVFTSHSQDAITLVQPDTTFKPERLSLDSIWKTQAINVGLNYELSQHLIFGAAWQAPLNQQSAYKTNCIMLSLAGLF